MDGINVDKIIARNKVLESDNRILKQKIEYQKKDIQTLNKIVKELTIENNNLKNRSVQERMNI